MVCEGPAFELPGEAAADKRPPSRTSGLQARQGAAHFAHPSWERQCQFQQLFLHTSAGMNPARSVPGSRGTAVPAVGADIVGFRSRCIRQRLRRRVCARLRHQRPAATRPWVMGRPAFETPNHQGPQADVRFSRSDTSTAVPRPNGRKRVKIYTTRGSGRAAAGCVCQ